MNFDFIQFYSIQVINIDWSVSDKILTVYTKLLKKTYIRSLVCTYTADIYVILKGMYSLNIRLVVYNNIIKTEYTFIDLIRDKYNIQYSYDKILTVYLK